MGFIGPAGARTIHDSDSLPTAERAAAMRLSQNLPSNVEQQLGIRPNSANPGHDRGGGRRGGRYEVEQRRGYGGRGYRGVSPEVDRCEGIAAQRGLVGRDFSRFVRYCLER
jgi:hypothetical protein